MPTRLYNTSRVFASETQSSTVIVRDYANIWERSPRVNGRLVLRPNPLTFTDNRLMSARISPHWVTGRFYPPPAVGSYGQLPDNFTEADWLRMEGIVRAKINGKLRKGSASLGVTLASWKQSRDMIVSRSRNLSDRLDTGIRFLEKDKKALDRLRRQREPLADQVLETKFGWMPLFEDLHAALSTVCGKNAIPPEYVRSAHRVAISYQNTGGVNPTVRQSWDGQATVTASTRVDVTNPNLWLLNRMGLINPATVVWDLIPWSFVVNMFVNVNSMINSVTDEVGLTFAEQNITRTSRVGLDLFLYNPNVNFGLGNSEVRYLKKRKQRTVGSLPKVSWQVRVPDLNWDLAVTAASLAVQKFKKINQLIRLI